MTHPYLTLCDPKSVSSSKRCLPLRCHIIRQAAIDVTTTLSTLLDTTLSSGASGTARAEVLQGPPAE